MESLEKSSETSVVPLTPDAEETPVTGDVIGNNATKTYPRHSSITGNGGSILIWALVWWIVAGLGLFFLVSQTDNVSWWPLTIVSIAFGMYVMMVIHCVNQVREYMNIANAQGMELRRLRNELAAYRFRRDLNHIVNPPILFPPDNR